MTEARILDKMNAMLATPMSGLCKSVADLKRDFRAMMGEMREHVRSSLRD